VLQQTHQPYLFGVTTMSRAQIAAVLGDRALAVQLMRRAFAEGREYTVYTHIDLGSELLRGYPPYQELMKPKG
jgi:hypothetical protein